MLSFMLIALAAGFLLSNQTPINTDLRRFSGSPLAAGLISFAVGTVFLALITLLATRQLMPSAAFISRQPLWIWLGGLLGAIYLTSNILLFPRLGALQTVILPIFGQILMGTLIDSTGLWRSPMLPMSLTRAAGLILLIIGVLIAVVLPARKAPRLSQQTGNLLPWRLWAVLIGMLGATQQAINGHLGVLLHNSAQASFISFLIGTLLISIVVLATDHHSPSLSALTKAKPWNFIGGILGALFVFATVVAVPQIGAGLTIMMSLIGQIAGGMLVQQLGWWRSQKTSIQRAQVIGVLVMVAGVVLVKVL